MKPFIMSRAAVVSALLPLLLVTAALTVRPIPAEPAARRPVVFGRPAPGCPWRAPVDAPIVDPFRRPTQPYGPGNRGLEYGITVGQAVTAVARGRVMFVGPVGGRRYVVLSHSRGLRSTYGPLATTSVVRGQELGVGHDVGTADEGLLLTARVGDRYIDPAPLLAGRCGRARLVAPRGPR